MLKAVFAKNFLMLVALLLILGGNCPPEAFAQATGPGGAAAHNQRGVEYFNRGHYDHAPRNQKTEAERNYRFAEKEFREAIAMDPAAVEPHRNLARLLFVQQNYAGAAGEYRTVVELSGDDLDAYVNLALALIELQRPEEAIAWLESAKRRATDEKALVTLDGYIARLRAFTSSADR